MLDAENLRRLTAEIVGAYVAHNSVPVTQLSDFIGEVHATLAGLGEPVPAAQNHLVPAVPIRKSVTPDYIVCLDDGKQFLALKGHLAKLGMTPAEYRAKWNLPGDYPMVAPNYSAKRSHLAKTMGLGRKANGGRE